MLAILRNARPIGIAAALLVVAAFAVTLIRESGGSYTLRAHFQDAGQLVKGGAVQAAGRTIGTIPAIRLTDDGLAEVVLEIDDPKFQSLHRGTTATIRQVGLSGIANRFVEIVPGPASAPRIPDNGVLGLNETKGIVDLDHLLNTLDPPTRAQLQGILRNGARIFDGPPTPRDANRVLHYLNPALSQAQELSAEALVDRAGLEQLLRSSAVLTAVFAGRRGDVSEGIANTADTFHALSTQRVALADALKRTPPVIRQTRAVLADTREILPEVRVTLREAQPVAAPLARTLRLLPPTVEQATPVVSDLNHLLPLLRDTVVATPALRKQALPAVDSLTIAVNHLQPILAGLRPYADDLITGFLIGFGGASSGYYDANGEFSRVSVQLAPEAPLINLLDALGIDVGSLTGYRVGLDKRCPGAAAESAPDESNPWPNEANCNSHQNHEG